MNETTELTFEATRCPKCLSDEIYVLQDDGSGICWKCKEMIPGPIQGGFGYHEAVRRMGLLPEQETVNDIDKRTPEPKKILPTGMPSDAAAAVARDVAALVTPKSPTAKVPTKEVEKSKPGKVQSFIEMLTGAFKKSPDAKPKAAAPPKEPPPAKSEPKSFKLAAPSMGETWQIGPCAICGLSQKKVGRVVACGGRPFVKIDTGHYGCALCAKKA